MINFKSSPNRDMVKMLHLPRHDFSRIYRTKDYFGGCRLPGLDDFTRYSPLDTTTKTHWPGMYGLGLDALVSDAGQVALSISLFEKLPL